MRGTLLDGRYRLGEPIGAGGMGEVWRARDEELGREVAVKIFAPAGDVVGPERDELLARFRREARAAAALSSPHIVTVFDHGTGRTQDAGGVDIPYLVMELLPGRSFQEVLRDEGRIPLVTALEWTEQVCTALTVAHTAGVIHRDIKPGNLMVGPEGRVQVLDFGIATFLDGLEAASRLTRTGQSPLGSVLYMAPEQFRMERGDGRVDLYALGCVLYELLVGRPPFVGPSAGVMYNHLNDKPLLPSRARPELPHAVDQLILALMAKDPRDRPVDAAKARDRVRAALEAEAGVAAEPPAVHPEPTPGPAPEAAPAPAPAPTPVTPPAPPAVRPAPEAPRRRPVRSGLSAVERKRRHNEMLRAAPGPRKERAVDARRIRRVRRHDATAQDPEPYVRQQEKRRTSPVMSALFAATMGALLFAPQVFAQLHGDDRDGSGRSSIGQDDAASDSDAGSGGPSEEGGASGGPYTVAVVTSADGGPRQSLLAEQVAKDVPRHLRPEIVVKQVDSAGERAEVAEELAKYPNLLAVAGETTPDMLAQLRTPVVSTCHVSAQPVPRDDASVVSLAPDAVEQGQELATYLEDTVKSRRLLVVSDRNEPADQDDAEHTTGVGGYLLRAYDNAPGLSALWAADHEARGPASGVRTLLDEVQPDAVVVDAPQKRAEESAQALNEAGFEGTMLLVDRHDDAGHCSDADEPAASSVPAGTLRARAVSRAVDGTVCATAAESYCRLARDLPERRGAVEEYQAATLLSAALNSSEAATEEESVTKARESLKWSLDRESVESPEGTYQEKHTYAPGLRPLWLDRLGTGGAWQQVGLLTKGGS